MNLEAIQTALREAGVDGWLFYDHHHRDPIGERILGLDPKAHITRRWYYFIPLDGEPRKLVHRIEQGRLDSLPGSKGSYSSWQELAAGLEVMLTGAPRLAMQYSPNNAIMYVSMVDAGTVEFLRGLGKQIVSSADLVSQFEAVLNADQIASHAVAQKAIDTILEEAWRKMARTLRPSSGGPGTLTEFAMVQWLSDAMQREGLVWENGPNVSANANSSDSHYEPTARIVGAHPQRRLHSDRHLGQARQAGQHLLRHHLDRRGRPRAHEPRTAGLRDRAQRPRRRYPHGRSRIRREPSHSRL